jgi:hypothetical protein
MPMSARSTSICCANLSVAATARALDCRLLNGCDIDDLELAECTRFLSQWSQVYQPLTEHLSAASHRLDAGCDPRNIEHLLSSTGLSQAGADAGGGGPARKRAICSSRKLA